MTIRLTVVLELRSRKSFHLGTDNVVGQLPISIHIFLAYFRIFSFVFSWVSAGSLNEQKNISFLLQQPETLSHLELILKRKLFAVDVNFKNWGISLG